MDRNDTNYFKRLTPEILESRFTGYSVPENIKQRAKTIMRRFTINGECDGMYIANSIALANGTGDGCGNFTDGEVLEKNTDKIVKSLMGAYGCNIYPNDKDDLVEIIAEGSLRKDKMLRGLRNAIRVRRTRIETIRKEKDRFLANADILNRFDKIQDRVQNLRDASREEKNWRIEFLKGEIGVIKDTITAEMA